MLKTQLEEVGLLDKRYRMTKLGEDRIAVPISGNVDAFAHLFLASGEEAMPFSTAILGGKKQPRRKK